MEWGLFGGAFLAWCAVLCWFDVRSRRLPNALTLPAAAVAVAASAFTAFDGDLSLAVGAAIWTGVNGAAFLMHGMGAGDVKLAPTLGAVAGGLAGVPAVLLALLGAQVITVAWAAIAREKSVPHGPAMILAAVATVAIARSAG